MLRDDVCKLAPLQEMGQSLYLSHESIAFYVNIQETYGELHQSSFCASTMTILTTDFPKQNCITIGISTKYHKTIEFEMLFRNNVTPLPKSRHMIQYLFEGMFICYILQK